MHHSHFHAQVNAITYYWTWNKKFKSYPLQNEPKILNKFVIQYFSFLSAAD